MGSSGTADELGGIAVGVVLVHGLWHGGWVWDGVREHLSTAGISSLAVELPMTSLQADVDATVAALDGFDRPTVLVGHSYGGAVITAAGTHPRVEHLVYLAAFQLDVGESVSRTLPELDIPGTGLGAALRLCPSNDLVTLDPERAVQVMYADATSAVAAAAVARLSPVNRAVFRGVPTAFAWRHKPSTYVVCTEDRAVHPDLQRAMADRATHRRELRCGHSAAAVQPREVAELIESIATPAD